MRPTVGCVAMRNAIRRQCVGLVAVSLAALTTLVRAHFLDSNQPRRLDPAAWGGDHVGKPIPTYLTGDECLFCHRDKVGTTWGANRHNLTIRPFGEDSLPPAAQKELSAKKVAGEIKFVLGNQQRQRFLKPAKA